MVSKSAYGANPNAGVNVNADHGWGGYQWPGGVPSNLLGTTSYQQVNGRKQVVRVTVRRELVPLFTLAAALADRKHNYQINVTGPNDGKPWGPWGYENRNISGSSTASNHSKGKAWDVNAPNNPYTAEFISDLPPGLVSDWERIGLCWGGRYSGRTDTMHFEYGYSPDDVARHTALALQLLGTDPGKPNNPDPEEDDMPYSEQQIKELVYGGLKWLLTDVQAGLDLPVLRDQVRQVVKEELAKLPAGAAAPTVEEIWAKKIISEITGQPEDASRTLQAINTKVFGGAPAPAPVDPTYTVVAGDSLGAIAKKFGVAVADLVAWNGLSDPNNISVGQVLKVGKA